MTLIWYRRWALAILHWLQTWVGQQLEKVEGPTRVTPKVEAAFADVAPYLLEVRRHMHNVKAAFPRKSGEDLRSEALAILIKHGLSQRRAAFAIEVVMQEWM